MFEIFTDSCSDLSPELAKELNVSIAPLGVEMDGRFFEDGQMPAAEFYAAMRAGSQPTTSAVNPDGWSRLIQPALEDGRDVLVIAFTAALSATCQSAVIAAEELREKYPQRKILVVDSLSASSGQGMLVWHASQLRAQGKNLEEVYNWVMENRNSADHWVTVDDLTYLKRGGRISATTAAVGTMLSIKPILHITDEGKLVSHSKARGRKAALNALLDKMAEVGKAGANEVVFVSHADCGEDARWLAREIRERFGVKEVIESTIGDVVGSHIGPGGILLSFMSEHR